MAAAQAEPPVTVPGDAIIVPYDVKSKTGVQDADHLLVPYDRYVELWNQANPDKKLDAHPAPLPYALSGAAYHAVLEGEETLKLHGQMQVNVLAEGYVSVPFELRGGVLAGASLDGKPARLNVVVAPEPAISRKGRKSPAVSFPCSKRQKFRLSICNHQAPPRCSPEAKPPRPWTRRIWFCRFPARASTSWNGKCG